mgnify:CR=1
MEQFDTDDNLMENSKEKKPQKATASQFLLIGTLSLIALVALFLLFKYLKNPSEGAVIDSSKLYCY